MSDREARCSDDSMTQSLRHEPESSWCPQCTKDLDADGDCFECGTGKYARDCKCGKGDWLCPDHQSGVACKGVAAVATAGSACVPDPASCPPVQVQAIRAVLDDVCGACVASDTRVHSALAALDALVAECNRLRAKADGWVQHDTEAYSQATTRALARAEAAEGECDRLRTERGQAAKWLDEHFQDYEDGEETFAQLLERLFQFGDAGYHAAGKELQRAKAAEERVQTLTEAIREAVGIAGWLRGFVDSAPMNDLSRERLASKIDAISDVLRDVLVGGEPAGPQATDLGGSEAARSGGEQR